LVLFFKKELLSSLTLDCVMHLIKQEPQFRVGFLRLSHPAFPPVALIAGMYAVFVVWNSRVGLQWQMPAIGWLVAALLISVAVSVYASYRHSPRLAEYSLAVPFYLIYPVVGIKLSYLCFTLRRPLVDALIGRIDRAAGFSWAAWAHVCQIPWFKAAQFVAYYSHFYQILFSILIFGLVRPGRRTYEMLFILVAGLIITLAICALFPTLGPESLIGLLEPHETVIRAVRAGGRGPFPYLGLISFPSYHTLIAITFIYCHRDIRPTRIPVLLLNLAMLVSIPFCGDHCLTDMVGGAAVALIVILLSRYVYRHPARPALV